MEYTKIKKIHVTEAGTLSNLLPMDEAEKLEVLILSGYLNTKDFEEVIDDLCLFWPIGYDEYDDPIFDWDVAPNLRVLDMGGCELVGSTTLPEFGTHIPLDKIVLPKNTEYLSYESAIDESFVREVVLPETLKSIKGIKNCERLEKIVMPESVEHIGMFALVGCPQLKELYIPKNVKTIDGALLAGCSSISKIKVSEENKYFTSVDGVVYTKDLKKLVAYPCGSGRTMYNVLEGTEELSFGAFMDSDIEDLVLPDSLKVIEDYCFRFCYKLKRLNMPDSVTKLGKCSLEFCGNLEYVHLSSSLKKIDGQTFGQCVKLKYLDVPSFVKTFDVSAISWNEQGFEEIVLHEGLEDIIVEHGGFMFCRSSVLRKINIPSTVKELPTGLFRNCVKLDDFTISEKNPYFKLEDGAIYSKDGKTLVSVTNWNRENFSVLEGTEIIGEGCFWMFDKLKVINLPSTLRKIERRAFDGCSSLSEISLPEGMEEIGERAFDECTSLNILKISAKNTPKITGIEEDENAMKLGPRKLNVFVPAESLEVYQSDANWKVWNIKAL